MEFTEQVADEPFDVVYTFDLIKQNLNQVFIDLSIENQVCISVFDF